MQETVQLRVHGDSALPTLIYLPGLHGDWTLIGAFRRALNGRVRFVEVTYPRTLDWSVEDYAANVEMALEKSGIVSGWLLAESFGSQPAWFLMARGKLRVDGLILAGGFVQHPIRWGARLAERIAGGIPLALLTRIMFGYARIARFRFGRSPETLADIQEFIDRRTELDRRAARHRLHLVAQNDPRILAQTSRVPVFALTGSMDPIVPWVFVRRWLKKYCPALRDFKIIWRADHNVLGTAPEAAAEQVLRWMKA